MKKKKKNILAWPVFKYDSQPNRDQIVSELQSVKDVVDVQSVTDTQDVINDDMVKRGEQLTHGMHEVHEINDVRSVESLTPDIATSLTDIRPTITDSQNISNIHNLTDNILAR